jgi:hypothetical protein
MEQAELKGAIDTMKAQEPPAPPSVLPDAQTQGNHIERVPQFKAADPRGPLLHAGKKVAILGFTDSFKQAPFGDPTWEIWGLNELYMLIPRWSRWFEIHSRDVYEADKKRTSDHIYALRAMTVPVYMHQHYDDIPMSVPYPLQAIAQAFPNPGAGGRPYLTNSIAYMLALAIAEGFQEIGVFGVDMAHDSEYQQQRPSCEYFIGIAQGRGIKVTIPPDCELLKTDFLYGFEQEQLERWNARMVAREADLVKKINELDAQMAQATEARAQYRGALQDTQHLRKNWKGLVTAT